MNILIFILGLLLVILNIGAIATVLLEDILYSKKQKAMKALFILFVPFIGAIRELWILRKFNKKSPDFNSDPNSPTRYSSNEGGAGGGD